MIGHWWRRRRDARTLSQRAIPAPLWHATLQRYPFLARRAPVVQQRLHALASLFLDRKEFSGAGGLTVSDEIAVAIAAQACLPVLNLDLSLYDGFIGIVVHPDPVRVRRERIDEIGIVHEYDEELAGEAMDGGPMMLSWQDVADAGHLAEQGYNVVIHEFVHVLDLADGVADGVPPLPDRSARLHWRRVMEAGHQRLCRELDAGRTPFLDPYGAEAIEEFFPVVAEAFFVAPEALQEEQPALYELLASYFRQDPAARD